MGTRLQLLQFRIVSERIGGHGPVHNLRPRAPCKHGPQGKPIRRRLGTPTSGGSQETLRKDPGGPNKHQLLTSVANLAQGKGPCWSWLPEGSAPAPPDVLDAAQRCCRMRRVSYRCICVAFKLRFVGSYFANGVSACFYSPGVAMMKFSRTTE